MDNWRFKYSSIHCGTKCSRYREKCRGECLCAEICELDEQLWTVNFASFMFNVAYFLHEMKMMN